VSAISERPRMRGGDVELLMARAYWFRRDRSSAAIPL
jgi:hypothetical protein